MGCKRQNHYYENEQMVRARARAGEGREHKRGKGNDSVRHATDRLQLPLGIVHNVNNYISMLSGKSVGPVSILLYTVRISYWRAFYRVLLLLCEFFFQNFNYLLIVISAFF